MKILFITSLITLFSVVSLNSYACEIKLSTKSDYTFSFNATKYSKFIKKHLRAKGYILSENAHDSLFSVAFEPLQGAGSFGTNSLGVLIKSHILGDYILVEGTTYNGLLTKRALIRKALKKVPNCRNR